MPIKNRNHNNNGRYTVLVTVFNSFMVAKSSYQLKIYQSIPYTTQIPAGTSFSDRRNLPYSLVGLFSCCEKNYSERKGNNSTSN